LMATEKVHWVSFIHGNDGHAIPAGYKFQEPGARISYTFMFRARRRPVANSTACALTRLLEPAAGSRENT
jgi:hypothetical protein